MQTLPVTVRKTTYLLLESLQLAQILKNIAEWGDGSWEKAVSAQTSDPLVVGRK